VLADGDIGTAKRHFTLARDWDALQFRTDSRLNELIRRTVARCASEGLHLVDLERTLGQSNRCPDGIPGAEFFYEHVHFDFDGDYEVARSLLPVIVDVIERRRGWSATDSAEIPSRLECAERLGFTAWDEVNTAAAMVKLTSKPPFTGQLEHAARQAEAEKTVSAVMDRVDERFIQDVIQAYREAIEANPQDWHLHYNLAVFLHQLNRAPEAAREFDYVVRRLPHVSAYRTLLAYALGKAGLWDQAQDHFREVLRRDRSYQPARDGLRWARKAAAGR
jgi:tetratricopeptide (TPR) repeat protein